MIDRSATRRGEAGFSVIEGLIAAALLLIITVGILPLFSRSMVNNVRGNDATRQANGAVDELERTTALQMFYGDMTIPGGQTTRTDQTAIAVVHLPNNEQVTSSTWQPYASLAPADVMMRRTRTLRQYSFNDYRDTQTFDAPLVGETEQRLVHMKVVDVVFEEPLNPANTSWRTHYTVRSIQAY